MSNQGNTEAPKVQAAFTRERTDVSPTVFLSSILAQSSHPRYNNATQGDSMDTPGVGATQVYTIGHSDHSLDAFLALLRQNAIAIVVDVRSQPYSQWVPHFNRENLARDLRAAQIHYVFMGDSLGGRPADPMLYDPGDERPNYERLAASANYLAGIEQLLQLAAAERVAILCSEGDYHKCHRGRLIAPTLLERHVRVLHICPDGSLAEAEPEPRQLALF